MCVSLESCLTNIRKNVFALYPLTFTNGIIITTIIPYSHAYWSLNPLKSDEITETRKKERESEMYRENMSPKPVSHLLKAKAWDLPSIFRSQRFYNCFRDFYFTFRDVVDWRNFPIWPSIIYNRHAELSCEIRQSECSAAIFYRSMVAVRRTDQ